MAEKYELDSRSTLTIKDKDLKENSRFWYNPHIFESSLPGKSLVTSNEVCIRSDVGTGPILGAIQEACTANALKIVSKNIKEAELVAKRSESLWGDEVSNFAEWQYIRCKLGISKDWVFIEENEEERTSNSHAYYCDRLLLVQFFTPKKRKGGLSTQVLKNLTISGRKELRIQRDRSAIRSESFMKTLREKCALAKVLSSSLQGWDFTATEIDQPSYSAFSVPLSEDDATSAWIDGQFLHCLAVRTKVEAQEMAGEALHPLYEAANEMEKEVGLLRELLAPVLRELGALATLQKPSPPPLSRPTLAVAENVGEEKDENSCRNASELELVSGQPGDVSTLFGNLTEPESGSRVPISWQSGDGQLGSEGGRLKAAIASAIHMLVEEQEARVEAKIKSKLQREQAYIESLEKYRRQLVEQVSYPERYTTQNYHHSNYEKLLIQRPCSFQHTPGDILVYRSEIYFWPSLPKAKEQCWKFLEMDGIDLKPAKSFMTSPSIVFSFSQTTDMQKQQRSTITLSFTGAQLELVIPVYVLLRELFTIKHLSIEEGKITNIEENKEKLSTTQEVIS